MKTSILFLLSIVLFVCCTKDEPANDGLNIPSINNVTDPLNYIKYDVTGDANFSVNTSDVLCLINFLRKKDDLWQDSLDVNGKKKALGFSLAIYKINFSKFELYNSLDLSDGLNKTGIFNNLNSKVDIYDTLSQNYANNFQGNVNANITSNFKNYIEFNDDNSNYVEGTFTGTIRDSIHNKILNFKNGKFRIFITRNQRPFA